MKVVYPGSFDPPTNGHLDIIKRASNLFDEVIVAVLQNKSKSPMFTAEERIEMLYNILEENSNIENVKIYKFEGLLVDFCIQINSKVVIRGLRAVTDFEYEFQIALTNRIMSKDIETLFIPTDTNNLWLSSSIVKEIAIFNGEVDNMVPACVKQKLKQKFS